MATIKKLWSGGYSLPVAFWLFHILGVCLAFLLLVVALLLAIQAGRFDLGVVLASIPFWTYWIVSVVGVWRSASPYIAKSGAKRFWGWAARILVALWTARGLYGLVFEGAGESLLALVRGG
jgi:hypothetical protein